MSKKRWASLFFIAVVSILAPSMASDTTTYAYDALGRLVTVSVSGGPAGGTQTSTAFDPAGNRASYSVTGVPASATFSVNSVSATEGAAVVFTVTKTGTPSGSLTVNYATSNGTASSGSDYTATSGTLTFLTGESTKTVPVPTSDDTLVEGSETFTLTLSGASSGAAISGATGTGTIVDNDASFAIANASPVTEGGTMTFTVTKTGGIAASVNYASAGGTATSGTDFTPVSGTLSFLAGDTTRTIMVATIDDSLVEAAETVLMNLSSPTGGATIATAQGTGTINDNEGGNQPPVAVADTRTVQCNSSTFSFNPVSNDTDPEGNTPLTLVSVTRLSGGATITVSAGPSPGTIVIELGGASAAGTSTFSYVVSDSLGATSTGSITITTSGGLCGFG